MKKSRGKSKKQIRVAPGVQKKKANQKLLNHNIILTCFHILPSPLFFQEAFPKPQTKLDPPVKEIHNTWPFFFCNKQLWTLPSFSVTIISPWGQSLTLPCWHSVQITDLGIVLSLPHNLLNEWRNEWCVCKHMPPLLVIHSLSNSETQT